MKMHFTKWAAVCCGLFLTVLLWPSQNANAQTNINEGFEVGTTIPAGWNSFNPPASTVTGFFTTPATTNIPVCEGLRSARTNPWVSLPQRQLTAPGWISNGQDIDISFDYKIVDFSTTNLNPPTAPGWGFINVEYSTDAGATWNTAFTINDDNHVTSGSCANIALTIDGADAPTGSDMRLRWFCQWANPNNLVPNPDYWVYLDDIIIFQEPTDPPQCVNTLINPANGSSIITSSLTLTWAAPAGLPSSYNVTVTNTTTSEVFFSGDTTSTSVLLAGLTPGAYEALIIPSNSLGTATGCTPLGFTIGAPLSGGDDCTAPAVITSLPIVLTDNTANFSNAYTSTNVPPQPATFPAPVSNGSTLTSYMNGAEAVYEYTSPTNSCLNITVSVPQIGTSFTNTTGLHVISGCPFNTLVAYSNSTSFSTPRSIQNLPIAAGQTYYIVISTNNTLPVTTPFTLSITECAFDCPDLFANIGSTCDDGNPNTFATTINENCECEGTLATGNMLCSGAANIACGAVVTGSTVGAAPDVQPFCGTSDGTGGGRWYRTAVGVAQEITLSTCSPNSDFDTKIRVFSGNCAELVCEAGNDDFTCVGGGSSGLSTVTFTAQPGTLYYILVHGFSSAEGTFELSVSCSGFDCPSLGQDFGSLCQVNQTTIGVLDSTCTCVDADPPFTGCTSGTSFGTHTTNCDAVDNFAQSTSSWVNEYTVVNNILNGVEYTFSISNQQPALPNIIVTITDSDLNVLATGVNSVTITATENTQGWRFYSHGYLECTGELTGSATAHTRRTTWNCANQIFDCPGNVNFGDACDDDNPNTAVDIIQPDCTCAGTLIKEGSCDESELVTSLPFNASGNTGTYVNSYTEADRPPLPATFPFPVSNGSTLTSYLNGAEAVYEYTSPTNSCLNITVSVPQVGTTTTNTTGLHVMSGCPFTTLVAYSNSTSIITPRSIQNLPIAAGQTYYIVISTNNITPVSTPFTLEITECAFDCPDAFANVGTACDDGDPTTAVDTLQPDCTCAGIPIQEGSCVQSELVSAVPFTATSNTGAYVNTYTSVNVPAGPVTFPAPVSNGSFLTTYLNGPEAVYEWTAPANGLMDATLADVVGSTGLWVFRGCPFNEVVAHSISFSSGSRSILNLPIQADNTYYFVVSTTSAATPYTINLEFTPWDCQDELLNIGAPCSLPLTDSSTFVLEVDSVLALGFPNTFEANDSLTIQIPENEGGVYTVTVNANGVASNGSWASEFRVRLTGPNGENLTLGAPGGSTDEWAPSTLNTEGPITGSLTLNNVVAPAGSSITIETRMSINEGPQINAVVDLDFTFVKTGDASTIGPDCQCTPLEPVCNANGGTLVWEGNRSFCVGTGTPKGINVAVTGASGTFQRWGLFNSAGQLVDSRGGNSQFNLDTYAPGDYTIRYIRYEADVDITQITSLASINSLEGCFGTSNAISLFLRPEPNGGTLTATSSTTICANAGPATGIQLALTGFNAENRRYAVVSQALGNQVVLTATGSPTGATFNLNGLPTGTYRAVALGFQQGASVAGVQFQSQLTGCFALSNLVTFSIVDCLSADLSSSPNPTPGQSFVTFTNPREEYATLEVYDMSGRMVERLFNQVTAPGQEYRLEFNGGNLPNGVYLYRLTTDSEVIVEKFMIAR